MAEMATSSERCMMKVASRRKDEVGKIRNSFLDPKIAKDTYENLFG